MKFGLQQTDIDKLRITFEKFPEIEQVLIFGSRAKGNSQAGSDIDLAVRGKSVTATTITRLKALLDDLPLPFFFDVVDFKTIQNKDLIDHINRVGQPLYIA